MNARQMLSRRQVLAGLGASSALIAVGGIAGCSRNPSGSEDNADSPGPSSDFSQPAELHSDDGRLTVALVAEAAMVQHANATRWALTYNESTPGPTLRVRPGDQLTISLENRLDSPTNLHTHGLHVSPDGDGDNVFVTVAPGASHTYRYRIPDDHPSGTFWYHPHHHGNVAPQVFGGLVGAIIVEDRIDQIPELAAATSRLLLLTDPNIGDSSSVLDASMMQRMEGREGTTVLVNGLPRPRIGADVGSVEHWRIVNASPSRFYALSLSDEQWHLIASDGGRLDKPYAADEIILVPGERAEVLIPITSAGTRALTTRTVNRGGMGMGGMDSGGMGMGGMGGRGDDSGAPIVIATLEINAGTVTPRAMPEIIREQVDRMPGSVDRTREVVLSMPMGMGMGGDGQFLIDDRRFDAGRTDIATRLGMTEDWVIRNTSTMDHPFHLHVWPFQVLERSDAGPLPIGWKDTVNIPANSSVRLRIPFRDIPGKTVYHCHILDHEDSGMMGTIQVDLDEPSS